MTGETERRSGPEFEVEVEKLLRDGGFRPTKNPGIARPRQTDIFARGDGIDLLVEAKNRHRKVDVSDIDNLRVRLGRVASDIVGIIFTTSPLTKGAISAIEADRTREVLAITGNEIDQLKEGSANLRTLIEAKRDALRIQGLAWFGTNIQSDLVDVDLPRGNVRFQIGDSLGTWFQSQAHFSHACYALSIPDTGWGLLSGDGAVLPLRLTLSSAEDLRYLLNYLHDYLGLSENGMFSIQQSETCWQGSGAESFVRAVECWGERYANSEAQHWHHSEDLKYFDQFREGWLLLSSRQRVGVGQAERSPSSFLHGSELAIQLGGVPVDMAPFLELCRRTGNDWARFEYIGVRQTSTCRLTEPAVLNVVGTVVRTQDRRPGSGERPWPVVGVIAENPFFNGLLPEELEGNEACPLDELKGVELLLCSLRDWHDEGDSIDNYLLEGFETTEAYNARVIRAFGTWDRILDRE